MTAIYGFTQDKTIEPEGNITLNDLAQDLQKEKSHNESVFPLEVFPNRLQQLIKIASPALGVHVEYLATSIIFAASIAIGKTHAIEVKKSQLQYGLTYLIIIGNSTSNKSGGLKFALAPILKKDSEKYEEYKSKLAQYQKEENPTEKPIFEQTTIGDYSRESLAPVLLNNLRGIAVYRDEISGWFGDFNRYSGSGEESFWLENWSGMPITINRKNSITTRIKNPFIGVGGTTQPAVIKSILKGERGSSGFTGRFLVSWPEVEKPLWTNEDLPEKILLEYQEKIDILLKLDFKEDLDLGPDWENECNPNILKISPDAKKVLFQYYNEVSKPRCDKTEDEVLKSVYGKFDLHCQRLALILQLIWFAYGEGGRDHVTSDTIGRAIKLTEYFRGYAEKLHHHVYGTELDKLPPDRMKVYKELPYEFSTAEGAAEAKKVMNMSKATFNRFLAEEDYFEQVKRGYYRKRIKT